MTQLRTLWLTRRRCRQSRALSRRWGFARFSTPAVSSIGGNGNSTVEARFGLTCCCRRAAGVIGGGTEPEPEGLREVDVWDAAHGGDAAMAVRVRCDGRELAAMGVLVGRQHFRTFGREELNPERSVAREVGLHTLYRDWTIQVGEPLVRDPQVCRSHRYPA